MKILVALKRVPDYEAHVHLKADASGIETEDIKWVMNPFDEIAVEEAVRLKEAGTVQEVVVVTIDSAQQTQQIRSALAMGADRGILVTSEEALDSERASRVLAKVYERESPDMLLMGKQAIDSDANQTCQLTAARLGIGQACFASAVRISEGHAEVTREVDGGLETIRIPLPCAVSTDLRLNEPRYPTLPNIMKAKKKPLDEVALNELGVDMSSVSQVVRLTLPAERKAGRRVATVKELVAALRTEAKVI